MVPNICKQTIQDIELTHHILLDAHKINHRNGVHPNKLTKHHYSITGPYIIKQNLIRFRFLREWRIRAVARDLTNQLMTDWRDHCSHVWVALFFIFPTTNISFVFLRENQRKLEFIWIQSPHRLWFSRLGF